MPFSNKRNSRDDKSGKAGRPGFNKRGPGDRNSYRGSGRPSSDEDRDKTTDPEKRPYGDKPSDRSNRPYQKDRQAGGPDRSRPFSNDKPFDRNNRPFDRGNKPFDRNNKFSDRGDKPFGRNSRPFDKGRSTGSTSDRPYQKDRLSDKDKPFARNDRSFNGERSFNKDKPYSKEGVGRKRRERPADREETRFAKEREDTGLIRLNRYIANSGICSRRKADELIEAGVVSVNGVVVSELGTKVDPMKDEIRYNGEKLKREKMVYVLLNKPKDYITTTDDPQERRTVMNLVDKATRERIYPVGRLDRNTTGLLLMTNDGDLAEKLSHPRNSITKIYQVELSKNLTQGDFNKIEFGLTLEDGFIKPDSISYVQGGTKKDIGIQIHSGKNRIVRRIFEHLGYDVVKLDRVIYANLTKKDLPRGRWRYLEEKEIIQLKHFIK